MIVLDTCAIIWRSLQPENLSQRAKKEINNSKQIIICDISLWEIAMLVKKNRIHIDMSYSSFAELILKANNYNIQKITPRIADLAVNLDTVFNQDPADRIIAATAITISAPLITADKNLRKAKQLTTIW